ncbi:cellulosome anchor protein [Gardnerella leopoldii]|uniref:Cellulosome anchor protein n=1 Tax=Gardnerella leopoldii TaxID=2792978 RepID=A0ABX4SGV5_9BIFI|nr:cellulosome anchor protein [Gardnerella vaginalis]PKZ19610.1 cellulosome anchor protein [Gardnerella vaginalis]
MNKNKTIKSERKVYSNTFSKKLTAASVAVILTGASISMFAVTANSAYANETDLKQPTVLIPNNKVTYNVASAPLTKGATTSQSSVEKTAAGLFRFAMNDPSLTAAQREDARKAYETLTGQLNKPSWYDSKVTLGKGDIYPDSLSRLSKAISYMQAINAYRQSIGLSPMGVSLQLTADAINDAFYSANHTDHARHYNTYENLAWADYGDGSYTGGTTPETMTGAMKQWITDEKKVYDEYKSRGQEAPEGEVGHYLNFINGSLGSMGFTTGNISNEYGSIAAWDASTESAPFTIEQYKQLIDRYINGNGGSSSQTPTPSVPDHTVPSVPDHTVPSVPDHTVPSVPDHTVPSVPDHTVPSDPEVDHTVTPDVMPNINIPEEYPSFSHSDYNIGVGDINSSNFGLGDFNFGLGNTTDFSGTNIGDFNFGLGNTTDFSGTNIGDFNFGDLNGSNASTTLPASSTTDTPVVDPDTLL